MAKIRGLIGLIKRNMLVYLNNKGAIFFSMLTPIIILTLYMLFLKSSYLYYLEKAASELGDLISAKDMDRFANGLMLVGIISSALITIPYNALLTIVRDREDRAYYDMIATPVKRAEIILSYFIAAVISAFLQTLTVLACGLIVLFAGGNMYITAGDILGLIGAIFLGTVSSTALFTLIMMFFRKMGTCSAFMGIISAVSGFLVGAYMPLSEFGKNIQNVCHLVPATGVTILVRNYLVGGILRHMDECIGGLDGGAFAESMRSVFSFNSVVGTSVWTLNQTCIYIIMMTIVLVAAIRVIYPRVYHKM